MAVQTFSFTAFVIGALVLALVVAGVVALTLTFTRKPAAAAATLAIVLLAIIGVGLTLGWTSVRSARVVQHQSAVHSAELEARTRHLQELIEQQQAGVQQEAERLRQSDGQRPLESNAREQFEQLRDETASESIKLEPLPQAPAEAKHLEQLQLSKLERLAGTKTRSKESLPEWIHRRIHRDGEKTFVVVSSQQFATPEQSRDDALEQARSLVQWDFDAEKGHVPALELPVSDFTSSGASGSGYHLHIGFGERDQISYTGGEWHLGPQDVVRNAVKDRTVEEIQRSAGENEFTVYRTHFLVELSPEVRSRIEPIWRHQVSQGRSTTVGGLLVLLTCITGIFAGYFRLDDRSGGRYRWPLRLGAVAATSVAIVACILGMKPLASERHVPAFEPAPTAPEVSHEFQEPMVSLPDPALTTPCQSFQF